MPQEQREIRYDQDLEIEAYRLSGVVQQFPTHFHDYYVIGFIEGGRRRMWCRDVAQDLSPGDLVLFNPRDSHRCAPVGTAPLDYRAVNIRPAVMERLCAGVTGRPGLPRFTRNAVPDSDIAWSLRALYGGIADGAPKLEREEALCFLLEQVLQDHAVSHSIGEDLPPAPIQALCSYMETHFTENITLDRLAAMTPFGKSYMLRSFTRQVGVSPYRYLQTVRLSRARTYLEQGLPPAEAAIMAGFADQSHFTRFFKEFTGLTPKQYQRIFPREEKGMDNCGTANR